MSLIFKFLCCFVLLYPETLANFPRDKFNRLLIDFQTTNRIPGLSVAVVDNNNSYIFNLGYSRPNRGIRVTNNTIFEIGSITKVFTTTLLGLQVIENRIDINQTLAEFLPFLRNHSDSPVSQLTIEELATQSSGLPGSIGLSPNNMTRSRVLNKLLSWVPPHPPGTKFRYSNIGFEILGYILENLLDSPYQILLIREISNTIGLNSTFISVPPRLSPNYAQGFGKNGKPTPRINGRNMGASSGLKSSSNDLIKFIKLNLGIIGSQRLLSAINYIHQPFFRANSHMVMGLGWQLFTDKNLTIIDKNGGVNGFSSYIGLIPRVEGPNIGISILSNKRCERVNNFGRQLITFLARRSLK